MTVLLTISVPRCNWTIVITAVVVVVAVVVLIWIQLLLYYLASNKFLAPYVRWFIFCPYKILSIARKYADSHEYVPQDVKNTINKEVTLLEF